ncbi:MAG: enoyl-CoA hydratase/isomerase family protein [Alphaproteobacteria bacterium]|nr:enoyl-CoA hydratase/isomerase family protein [Alphaproteobacteria bacterium]
MGDDMVNSSGFILTDRSGATGRIVIARPERRNALKSEMYAEIAAALRAFEADPAVHVVTLEGLGKDFCAGNDIGDFRAFGDVVEQTGLDPQSIVGRQTPSIDVVYVMMEMAKPLLAAVQGNAIGFGATMLLHCDVVVVDATARMKFPFVDLALVPEAGSSLLLRERMGFAKAAEVLFTGGAVDARDAVAFGLATELVAEGEAGPRLAQIADLLSRKPPVALQATKRLLKRDPEPLSARVEEEFRVIAERTSSAEAQAVFAAMVKKK